MTRRVGLRLPVGLEGAGVVVAAGENKQALVGKRVAVLTLGGGMFAQYKTVRADECVVLPDGITPEEGASLFVNPLTALAIVETARLEGHQALVHTAAASNLGQMLVKICLADGVPLVNVVRKEEHVRLLRAIGAKYVCDSSLPTFRDDLIAAIQETGASVAFDAIGGGSMAGESERRSRRRMPQRTFGCPFHEPNLCNQRRLRPAHFAHHLERDAAAHRDEPFVGKSANGQFAMCSGLSFLAARLGLLIELPGHFETAGAQGGVSLNDRQNHRQSSVDRIPASPWRASNRHSRHCA